MNDLQPICVDQSGGGTWFFDKAFSRYLRRDDDETLNALIDGKWLPDPEYLWGECLKLFGVPRESEMGQKLKPQPATYALWEHWQEAQRAAQIAVSHA
jgi:hypothetical protein